jgi:hypothetical protein
MEKIVQTRKKLQHFCKRKVWGRDGAERGERHQSCGLALEPTFSKEEPLLYGPFGGIGGEGGGGVWGIHVKG